MKELILSAVCKYVGGVIVDYADDGVKWLVKKIREAEFHTPGDGKGRAKLELVRFWIYKIVGDEVEENAESIEEVIKKIVKDFNDNKKW